ncbi:uncharacterized protein LOC131212152 [Anopheles bellator]|uniref:uncharacterized protein LOC131212152 n=1 Tax=Anopheles bellator TaxID=139047 RepID=UPI0026485460|nr:uncharacterized protein LOC131212152 [Anopheles bellator]
MGGCRCTFRECVNATSWRKELHFFRYPANEPERLRKWIQNANRIDFLDLPKDKLTNKVVCQEHFEQSMFMNYLRERLTKLAIPRLMPMEDGRTLNVETDEISDMDSTEEWGAREVARTDSALAYSAKQSPNSSLKAVNRQEDEQYQPTMKKVKILNSQALILNKIKSEPPATVLRIKTTKNCLNKVATGQSAIVSVEKVSKSPNPTATMTIKPVDSPSQSEAEILLHSIEDEAEDNEQEQCVDKKPAAHLNSRREEVSPLEVRDTETTSVPAVDPNLSETLERNNREIADLKKLVEQLLNRPTPQPSITSPPVAPVTTIKMEKGPQLTKAQLFNGIKRYLNPSMVTLLRMELFAGAPNRVWKTDEKSLAVDLLNIGEHVYDHFTEEFRFRLPSKSDARVWKDSGEIDADDAC